MAYARELFTGNGTNRLFNVNFPYLATAHVEVRVNGVLETGQTWINATTVQLATAPANGAVVEVKRNTPKETRLVDWSDGSAIREDDLDLADLQVLYITQEAFDTAAAAILEDASGRFDALSRRIINVAAPVDAGDAVNKAYADAIINTAATSAAAAATSEANAAASEANAAASETNAAASASDAAASAANLPNATSGGADRWLKINSTADGWVYRTDAQVLSDIGAVPTARTLTAGSGLTGGGDLTANRTFAVDGTLVAFLASVNAFTRAQRYTPVVLTDAATIAWDLDVAPHARVTLAGNRTVGAPTNLRDGGEYRLVVIQDGTGGRTLAWNAAFDFGEDGTPTLPSGAGKIAIFGFVSDGTKLYCVSRWNN